MICIYTYITVLVIVIGTILSTSYSFIISNTYCSNKHHSTLAYSNRIIRKPTILYETRKNPIDSTDSSSGSSGDSNDGTAKPKGRGRPKKVANADIPATDTINTAASSTVKVTEVKKRGRPKKNAIDYNNGFSYEGKSDDISLFLKSNGKTAASVAAASSVDATKINFDTLDRDFQDILPNLEEDFANLGAALGDLDDFYLNFDASPDDMDIALLDKELSQLPDDNLMMSEQELDDALRSIEAGKFNLDALLLNDEGSLPETGSSRSINRDISKQTANTPPASAPRGRPKKVKVLANDDDDDEENEDEFEEEIGSLDDDGEISLESTGLSDDGDLMLDVVPDQRYNIDEEDDDADDDDEEEDDEDEVVVDTPKKKLGRPITTGVASKRTSLKTKANTDMTGKMSLDGKISYDDAAVDPLPLEEFKRLMESLGPESMYEDFSSASGNDDEVEAEPETVKIIRQDLTRRDKAWRAAIYEGGTVEPRLTIDDLERDYPEQSAEDNENDIGDLQEWITRHTLPSEYRVKIVSVVTNSSSNSTALDIVSKVYDYIKKGTENDQRITYQTLCFAHDDDKPLEELDDMIQMWLESYNTYHLVDGKAMKEAWGCIMPHIMLSTKNLDAIVDQVKWALNEDSMNGALLSPRMRRIRFRGGAQEMITGYNTEHLDSEFSVVSVR